MVPVLVLCSSGRFGACFLPALCKQSDLQVFAARPGLRLWRSDVTGQVEDTRLLKPLFNSQVHQEHTDTCSYSYCSQTYGTNKFTVTVITTEVLAAVTPVTL